MTASKHSDCTHCQEWELCPFHPAEPAPRAATAPASAQEQTAADDVQAWKAGLRDAAKIPNFAGGPSRAARLAPAPSVVVPADWRYLGLDDPEVLGPDTPPDLIYAVPGGGVMGVPQALAQSAPAATAVTIGGLSLSRDDFESATIHHTRGEFHVELLANSDHEIKLCAMYMTDKLSSPAGLTSYVAIDARPQFNFVTEHAWFQARHRVRPDTIEYVLRYVCAEVLV